MRDPELHYYSLSEDVIAFSTTRHGGAGKGNYGELNINPYCGDDTAAITANRQTLCKTLNIEDSHLLLPHQVHGIDCLEVTEDLLHTSPEERQQFLEGKDALMTDRPNICIGVSTADCIPVLLYDPRHHAAAAVHAGWRGTVNRIVKETFRKMQKCYGILQEDTIAVIGPGISLKNFEVGQEVYDAFAYNGFDMSRIACRFPCRQAPKKRNGTSICLCVTDCNLKAWACPQPTSLTAESVLMHNAAITFPHDGWASGREEYSRE